MKMPSRPKNARLTAFVKAALAGSVVSRKQSLAFAAAACGVFLSVGEAKAQTWTGTTDNNWNLGTNWSTNPTVPGFLGETATFGAGPANVAPTVGTALTNLGGITFAAGAPAYTIGVGPGITITNAGIVNNSGIAQTINNDNFGFLTFTNSSSAGNNNLVTINNTNFSTIIFQDTSTAGAALINNTSVDGFVNFVGNSNAGTSVITNYGQQASFAGVLFNVNSSAANATINNDGANAFVSFSDNSTAANSTITNNGVGSSVNFLVSASAGSATINNDAAGATILFQDNSSAGNAILNNNDSTAFITFSGNATLANGTINNTAGGIVSFEGAASAGAGTINNTNTAGLVTFSGTSTAGSSTINNSGTTASLGGILFQVNSSAGSSTILNSGADAFVSFSDNSTAASSTITNSGANSSVNFLSSASGGNAIINNNASGATVVFQDNTNGGGVTINNNDSTAFVYFQDNANLANGTINNSGGGLIFFEDSASAGAGVINNTVASGLVSFSNSSTAGSATIYNSGTNAALGGILFQVNSSAGSSTIINNGADAFLSFSDNSTAASSSITNSGTGSSTTFLTNATAGNATITNSGVNSLTVIQDAASGGTAAFVNANSTARIDISQLTTAGTTAGSVAGNGYVDLGSKTFTVGGRNTDATFSGIIRDGGIGGGTGGSITKVGTGTWTLTGANTFTGLTTAAGGTLAINGSIVGNAQVLSAGTLAGVGVIGGSVVNSGRVSPGATGAAGNIGNLTVNGNYSQNSGGRLVIDVGGRKAGQFDRLTIGGVATLAGGVDIVQRNGFTLKRGDRIAFLTATGGRVGQFSDENNDFQTGTLIAGRVKYESNAAVLEAYQQKFSDVSDLANVDLTPNQRAVARALDRVIGDRRAYKVIDYLDNRPLQSLPGDFDKIAPEEMTSVYNLAVSLGNVQTQNIQRRTDDIRHGAAGFSASGLAMNGSSRAYSGPVGGPGGMLRAGSQGLRGAEGPDGKESKAVYTPAPDNRWGVFITGVGEWTDIGNTGNARGYDMTTGGFTLGVDYKVTPNFAVGLTAGYAGTGVDLNDGGRVWVNGGKLGLYATYFTGGFYVDAAVSGGYNSYDTKRSALDGKARGSTDGGELNALISTGYDVHVGGLTFGPTASFQYTYVGIAGFDEHGSVAPLNYDDQSAESYRTALGLKASYDWRLGGVIIKPELRAAWQHEFGDTDYAFDSRFANGAGNTFTVHGPDTGRDSLLLGGGVAILWNERTSTYVYYDSQLARENYSSFNISGGMRVEF